MQVSLNEGLKKFINGSQKIMIIFQKLHGNTFINVSIKNEKFLS